MKKLLFFLFFILSLSVSSQVSVSSRHQGTSKKIADKDLERFSKTKTIFLFSNQYDKAVYEEILRNSWTVTPYEIVPIKDFKLTKYLDGSYSFASIATYAEEKQGSSVKYLYCYFDFFMFDEEKKKEELQKLAKKSANKIKRYDIMEDNKINLARVYFYPKDELISMVYSYKIDELYKAVLNDDVFFNYKPGFLRNYFQKVNQVLKDKETNWMYAKEAKKELTKLRTATLFVPEYLTKSYNPYTRKDNDKTEKEKAELFSKYSYKYEYLTDEAINEKILNNEAFYYLRYARINAERYVQVVNSTTGEIVYSDYMTGLGYQLKESHIKDLSDKIKKLK